MDARLRKMLGHLKRAFPNATITHSGSDTEKWITLATYQGRVAFAWRPREGFGFFAADAVFGEGPKTVIQDTDTALGFAVRHIQDHLGQHHHYAQGQ